MFTEIEIDCGHGVSWVTLKKKERDDKSHVIATLSFLFVPIILKRTEHKEKPYADSGAKYSLTKRNTMAVSLLAQDPFLTVPVHHCKRSHVNKNSRAL